MPAAIAVGSRSRLATRFYRFIVATSVVSLPSALAKDIPLNAIALYDASNGAAYVQLTDVTVNGKTELRTCDPKSKIDKSSYGKLPKVQLKDAVSLERDAAGMMVLTKAGQSYCVVPSNLKFENKNELTPAEVADKAVLQGSVVSSSANQPSAVPAFKPGVRLVFVAAADTELAEFLRAQRAKSIAAWQDFLSRYATSSHVAEAKRSLVGLFENGADAAFGQYQKSSAASPDWSDLKQAHQLAEQASHTIPNYPAAVTLFGQIRTELDKLIAADRTEMVAYRKALLDQSSGYAHLTAAKRLNDHILEVDPNYAPALDLQSDIVKESAKLDSTLQASEGLINSKRYDEALASLGAYRSFAPEVPRVESVVATVWDFHLNRAKDFASQKDWERAAPEYQKAVETRPENSEVRAALKDAEIQRTTTRNNQAAEHAIEASKAYAEKKQYIDAYEVLVSLTDPQRALVTDQIEALKPGYVPAAVQHAQVLQEVHVPIRGRADEDAVRQAYELLASAASLSDDPSVRLKRDLLSDKISTYYVEQAKRFLEKPKASGVGLGWCYLNEAQRYKQNFDAVKDQMTRYEPAYQLRAKLSIGVIIRDQTSRRESVGFADQLADAIATDMESSGLPVKVIRQMAGATANVDPMFLLVGEINEHRIVKTPTLETLQSKYRASIREVKNEAWLKANREYEAAQQDLASAQRSYDESVGRNKKKEIATAKETLAAAQKKAGDFRIKLDSIDENRPQDVIEPYNYTKTSIDLTGVIDLAFRITDVSGNLIEPTTPLKRESHKVYNILENVKPEDTEGVKAQNAPPDEGAFMTDMEIQSRDELIKSIHEKVLRLPAKILQEARDRTQQDDLEGAAEYYVIYLNATPGNASPERDEATKFLHDHFNVSLAQASPSTSHQL